MKTALENEESPLDATVESVLPGVMQQHHATQAEVLNIQDHVSCLEECLVSVVKNAVQGNSASLCDTFELCSKTV